MIDNSAPFLTVFTPSYNRAHTLGRLFESLKRQSSTGFEWILVDDGSTDHTQEMVEDWKKEGIPFPFLYIKKENGGMHTGYNTAIEHMNGTLAVCIDSDDYMPDDAVERILRCWKERGSDRYAGIIGLDYDLRGKLIGRMLPDMESISFIDMSIGKYGPYFGDKKFVVRADLYREVAPMKVFPGEKYFNPSYMFLEISRKYEYLVLNECICLVEYQPDGMGANMYRQYKNSPNSFLEIRKQFFSFGRSPLKKEMRNGIHFVSSALLAHRYWKELRASDRKPLLLLCTPGGMLLSVLVRIKG